MRLALIEPSRTVQRIITGAIERWGHEVQCFVDGPQALGYLQADSDVRGVISSIELASYSAMQLVRDARALTGTQRPLYILIMSSSDKRSKMIEALENGADDFISKPPAPEELRARLRAADRITSMQAELVHYATKDFLTGVLNRRAFVEAAAKSLQWASHGYRFSILLCDLDKFKAVNDNYGHDAGDLVLQKFSDAARATGLTVGRLGGEEFALLVEKPLEGAVLAAEDFREVIAGLVIKGVR